MALPIPEETMQPLQEEIQEMEDSKSQRKTLQERPRSLQEGSDGEEQATKEGYAGLH